MLIGMVIIMRNGISNQSSNPGQSYLNFSSCLYPQKKYEAISSPSK